MKNAPIRPPLNPPCGPNGERELLATYSRLDHSCSEVLRPTDLDALREMLGEATGQGRRVAFRAGGQSFHDQSLNDDMVISLEHFDRILDLDPDTQTITVEPAVPWGVIVEATLAEGLVPYVIVTSVAATAGGTLSSDGISRYSPSYGSESSHVERFDLLCVCDNAVRTIERPAPNADDENARLFRAVIGGFGYLGVVTRITYRLLSVREVGPAGATGPLQVATTLRTGRSFRELIRAQLEETRRLNTDPNAVLEERTFPRSAHEDFPAIYSVAFPHRGNARGAVYRSWYTRGQSLRPYFVYRPRSRLRRLVDLLASFTIVQIIGRVIAWLLFRLDARKQTVFVNEVYDYMFFMEANRSVKHFVEGLGRRMPAIQQTFVVPVDSAEAFLDEIPELMAAHRIKPTLFDILYMPRDKIQMSASNGLEGFACSLAFEDIRRDKKRDATIATLQAISEACERHGGRVHLTKNVYAEPQVLARMYQDQLGPFLELKRALDPRFTLRNDFFERVFERPARLAGAPDRLDFLSEER